MVMGMMKPGLAVKKEILITSPGIIVSQLPERRKFFHHINNLAAGRDVTVTSTMIKVTYKKSLKDQCPIDSVCGRELVFVNNINSDAWNDGETASSGVIVPRKSFNKNKENSPTIVQNKEVSGKKKMDFSSASKKINCDESNTDFEPSSHTNEVFTSKKGLGVRKLKENKKGIKEGKFQSNNSQFRQAQLKGNTSGAKRKDKIEENDSGENNDIHSRNVDKNKLEAVQSFDKLKEKGKKRQRVFRREQKPLLLEDPELPPGWTRYIQTRNKGFNDEKHDVFVVSPQGKKFRFKWKLKKYLEKKNLNFDPDQFFFGLYKRRPTSLPFGGSKKNLRLSEDSHANTKVSSSLLHNFSYSDDDLNLTDPDSDGSKQGDTSSKMDNRESLDNKELLLHDPDLPFGWRRIINSNSPNGRLQVHIISPDGKIFRQRYRLSEYLTKHEYNHNLDRFYFGLYPRKDPLQICAGKSGEYLKNEDDFGYKQRGSVSGDSAVKEDGEASTSSSDENTERNPTLVKDYGKNEDGLTPMYDDPSLPEGWKRFIKIRGYGETAGRMEVVVVSPDGRKFRTRSQVEDYIRRRNLDFKAEDFDFSVFGKSKRRQTASDSKDLNLSSKKRFKSVIPNDKPVPNLDVDNIKAEKITREGGMINSVTGLMLSCGLSSSRSERRSRVPRKEHEKSLRKYLETSAEAEKISSESCDIFACWIQRLLKCRSEVRDLEHDALSTIVTRTEDFIKELIKKAFEHSSRPEEGLRYDDLADVISKSESLSPLASLIPKRVTFREYVRLNRPDHFRSGMSFEKYKEEEEETTIHLLTVTVCEKKPELERNFRWFLDRYFMGEIHVIDAGIVLPYILDPNFENYLPMIPSEVNSVNFTWRSGSKKYFYNFDILKTLDESILDPPQISIKTRGKIPKRPKVFSVYLPCSGNRSGIAPFEVGLLIETRKGKPLVGTPLRLKLRKECAPRGPDPECDKKCANGGWCNHEKICQCPEGYMGQYCKTALCYPQCMNGGNCTAPGICSCPVGYQGRHCEGGICRDKCLNGGKCVQKDTCECPKGYFGRRCEYSKCVIPCLNGGKCRGANKCRCHIGYRGNHCEIDNRVSQRSLCSTLCGHGQCRPDNSCLCDQGWTGKKCQRKKISVKNLENT